jgi:hypothetical protein
VIEVGNCAAYMYNQDMHSIVVPLAYDLGANSQGKRRVERALWEVQLIRTRLCRR